MYVVCVCFARSHGALFCAFLTVQIISLTQSGLPESRHDDSIQLSRFAAEEVIFYFKRSHPLLYCKHRSLGTPPK